MLPNKVVKVFFAVVVSQLFARFDGLSGHNEYPVSSGDYFAVRSAGVIDITRNVLAHRAIDGAPVAEIEEILSTNLIRFLISNQSAKILHYKPTTGNALFRY